jgi:hypothetical protein
VEPARELAIASAELSALHDLERQE